MRRMTEQIGQLSVDLGVTRMELLKACVAVNDAVKAAEVDPMCGQLNESLKDARAQLEASKAAPTTRGSPCRTAATTHSRRCGPASIVHGRRSMKQTPERTSTRKGSNR